MMAGPLKYDIDVIFYETKWVDCSWCLEFLIEQNKQNCPYCGGNGKVPGDRVPINLSRPRLGRVWFFLGIVLGAGAFGIGYWWPWS